MKRKGLYFILVMFVILLSTTERSYAHCQVPCGIYDDYARVMVMLEDTATTEKAINEMKRLQEETDLNSKNQMIRWVVNKEKHAENIIDTISSYFLTQRVKEDQKDYEQRLIAHHRVIVSSMKVKQNTELEYVEELRENIEALKKYYPEHKH